MSALPGIAVNGIRYKLGHADIRIFKESLFSYLKKIPDAELYVEEFWNNNILRIAEWYLKQRRDDDLIISASPYFLIHPAAERLGVRCIASPIDIKTGRYSGENCHGEEKVRQFRKYFPDEQIESFYSDSFRDTPLARTAQEAFMVIKHGTLCVPWPKEHL